MYQFGDRTLKTVGTLQMWLKAYIIIKVRGILRKISLQNNVDIGKNISQFLFPKMSIWEALPRKPFSNYVLLLGIIMDFFDKPISQKPDHIYAFYI